MSKRGVTAIVGLTILIITGWWFAIHRSPVQIQGAGTLVTHTRQAPPSPAAPTVAPGATPMQKSKAEEMSTALTVLNHRPIEFYGKLVDQDGNPVSDADVFAGVMVSKVWMGGKVRDLHTKTDDTGSFSIKDIEGRDISFGFEKPGYEYRTDQSKAALFKYSLLTPAGERHKPNPNSPVIFTTWRLKGPEPLVHFEFARACLQVDGTPMFFDLVAGKKLSRDADLTVKLERKPEHIDRGQRFNWRAVIEVPTGGVIEQRDAYPNEAPLEGYDAQFRLEMPENSKEWQSSLTRSFYVKARGGKLFGRFTMRITANYEPPPTGITIEAWINPSGSRNLEYDPLKQAAPR